MRLIELNHGQVTIVDDIDYAWLQHSSWYARPRLQAGMYDAYHPRGQAVTRAITDAPVGYVVHHINGNTLDNRRHNLLIMSRPDHSALLGKG